MLLQLQAYILINGANYRIQARVHRSGLTIVERRKHLLTDSTQKKHFFQTRILAFLKKFQVQSNLNPPSSFVINRKKCKHGAFKCAKHARKTELVLVKNLIAQLILFGIFNKRNFKSSPPTIKL